MKKIPLISFLSLVLSINIVAQTMDRDPQDSLESKIPDNWFNLDSSEDNVQGISTDKTYELLLNGKTAKPVIVAVIDSGVDIKHEDLVGSIWVNEKEIANNGLDDDKNGYVDDIHGWNFLGNSKGENIESDSYELTREYLRLSTKFESKKKIKKKEKKEYKYYQSVKKEFERQKAETEEQFTFFSGFKKAHDLASQYLDNYFNGGAYTYSDISELQGTDQATKQVKQIMEIAHENGIDKEQLIEGEKHFDNMLKFAFNLEFDPRPLVGDDYSDINEKGYGNNDVTGPDAMHGTHVAGIIAANRNNSIGIKGISNNVKIMSIRAVPDGDERDKDIINAIYYAVDNGAQIINMSFGKSYSPEKKALDKAVKYAEKKNVLLIHAAGNSSKNIDIKSNFPSKNFLEENGAASNWIEVGASSSQSGLELAGSFSNYGKETVDIFAPGVSINATLPDNKYGSLDGTSMAAPMVSGLSALLLSYFPGLTAIEVKDIILSSATSFASQKVNIPSKNGQYKITTFRELSKTGAIINVYSSVVAANSISEIE
jgi:subtilisin family serine protease